MRQEHRVGDKLFVGFSSICIPITDPKTREVREAELFVVVLGASNYLFAVALPSQNLPCWIRGHILAYEHLGGVSRATIPDDTTTAVTAA